jgi:hypothetical protein
MLGDIVLPPFLDGGLYPNYMAGTGHAYDLGGGSGAPAGGSACQRPIHRPGVATHNHYGYAQRQQPGEPHIGGKLARVYSG